MILCCLLVHKWLGNRDNTTHLNQDNNPNPKITTMPYNSKYYIVYNNNSILHADIPQSTLIEVFLIDNVIESLLLEPEDADYPSDIGDSGTYIYIEKNEINMVTRLYSNYKLIDEQSYNINITQTECLNIVISKLITQI